MHQQLLTSKFGSEAAISVAESNLAELERLDKRNQEDVERLSEKEQKYLSLMRDVSVADEIYIMLAKRLEEAKVAEVAVSTEVQVVDTATLPEDPVKPKKLLTLLLAAFFWNLRRQRLCYCQRTDEQNHKDNGRCSKLSGPACSGLGAGL